MWLNGALIYAYYPPLSPQDVVVLLEELWWNAEPKRKVPNSILPEARTEGSRSAPCR